MLKESIRDLVLAIAEGDTLAIEDSFNSVMVSKISDRLDDMRVDVAQGMFGSVEESYDSSDAYETWDPKHPKFKEKLIKHQKNGGTTKSFIEKEKAKAWKKLTREEVELEELTLEDYSVEELEDFMMSEEFEQLDEVSKKTLGSYVTKANDQLMKHTAAVNFKSGRGDSDVLSYTHEPRTARKTANRTKGVATAIGKLTKEEVEELDELSKATLGSYVKKASVDAAVHTDKFGRGGAGVTYSNTAGVADKRLKGISKAVGKLTKESFDIEDYSVEELEDFMMSEEFEQLDELSKKTLGSYVKKAADDQAQHAIKVFGDTPRDKEEHAERKVSLNKLLKRQNGIPKAVGKLTKEEFELEEAVTASQLIANHNSSDHGGAQHFSNVDGKHHSWNYVKKNKEGTKYEVTPDKGEAEGIAHKGKFLKLKK